MDGWSDTMVRTNYYVKKVWNELLPSGERVSSSKLLWFPHSVPRHSSITWLVVQNGLFTFDRLLSWGARLDPSCLFCKVAVESREHLFFTCPCTKTLWEKVLQLSGVNRPVRDWSEEFLLATRQLRGKPISVFS